MGTSGNKIDSNLTAANIKSGVQIFWLTGSYIWWAILPVANTIAKFEPFVWFRASASDSMRGANIMLWFMETASNVYGVLAGAWTISVSSGSYMIIKIIKINKSTWVTTEYTSNSIRMSGIGAFTGSTYVRHSATVIYIGSNSWGWKYTSFDTATDTFQVLVSEPQQPYWRFVPTTSLTASGNIPTSELLNYPSSSTWLNPGTTAAPSTLTTGWYTYGITAKVRGCFFSDIASDWMVVVDWYLTRI